MNEKGKWTPGPWVINRWQGIDTADLSLAVIRWKGIARWTKGGQANALLIAAPELLEACEAAYNYLAALAEQLPQAPSGRFSDREPLALLSRLQAAITKAKEGKPT